jgi:uncharacterized protein (DUF1778 family)
VTRRTTVLTLRLTEAEADALRRCAELEGRSVSEVARAAMRAYLDAHRPLGQLDRVLAEELPRYGEALDRLGQ